MRRMTFKHSRAFSLVTQPQDPKMSASEVTTNREKIDLKENEVFERFYLCSEVKILTQISVKTP